MDIKCVSRTIEKRCQQLIIDHNTMVKLMDLLLLEVNRGLNKKENEYADVKCFVTHVHDLPSRKERGTFLALDLGGTNFRVLMIHLKDESDFEVKSKMYAVSQSIMKGTGEQLFDYIAECLANFMLENNVYSERLPLGFSFSFGLSQLSLDTGLLVRWGKDFKCSGVVGENVVQLLNEAIARRGDIQVNVCAILNDATGTLMSCTWKSPNCKIGLIAGTGTNVSYVEQMKNVETYDGSATHKSHVIINTEWSALGDNGSLDFIRTEYDRDIDDHSTHRGEDIFEKMISGMYMGELVRLLIYRFTLEGLLFNGKNSTSMKTRGQFSTKHISEIESDEPGNYENCMRILNTLGLQNVTKQDCANVRYICECVSSRSAHLVSAGIATLINKIDEANVTVGVDGSVYRFHPNYQNLLMTRTRQYVKPGISFNFMLSEDGSGCGAALVAAIYTQNTNP